MGSQSLQQKVTFRNQDLGREAPAALGSYSFQTPMVGRRVCVHVCAVCAGTALHLELVLYLCIKQHEFTENHTLKS